MREYLFIVNIHICEILSRRENPISLLWNFVIPEVRYSGVDCIISFSLEYATIINYFMTFEYNYLLTQPHYLFKVLTQMVPRQRPVLFIINKTLIAPPLKFTPNKIIFNHNISVRVINIC